MSALPLVLDSLLDLIPGAPGLEEVQVMDGPSAAMEQPDVMVLGWDFTGGAGANTEKSGAGLSGDRERQHIHGVVSSWRGDAAIKPRRDRAYEILNALYALLRSDVKVNGAAARAKLTVGDYYPEQTDKGAMVSVVFTISVDAFVR